MITELLKMFASRRFMLKAILLPGMRVKELSDILIKIVINISMMQ